MACDGGAPGNFWSLAANLAFEGTRRFMLSLRVRASTARLSTLSLGLMILASVLCTRSPCPRGLAMASIDNRASGEGLPRTASRPSSRLPAPPARSSSPPPSRCAFTPGVGTSFRQAVAVGGHRRRTSSFHLRHSRHGRSLPRQRHAECQLCASVSELRPNPALNRTRRFGPSTWRCLVPAGRLAFRWALVAEAS